MFDFDRSLSSKFSVLAFLSLAACDASPDTAGRMQIDDPLMREALADQIMVDPDMVNRNGANQVASFAPVNPVLPNIDIGPIAIRSARGEAIALIGGTSALRRTPEPVTVEVAQLPDWRSCVSETHKSFIWADRMPMAMPVYPRGAVLASEGASDGLCEVRAVTFETPVPAQDVLDFYFTLASSNDLQVVRTKQQEDDILFWDQGASLVRVRSLQSGLTHVQLLYSMIE